MASESPLTQKHKTENPYEDEFGYSRAVRKGPFIFVSGTTAIDPVLGRITLHPNSAYHQTLKIFSEIILALEALGATKEDVVRIRMFVTADEDSDGVGRALKEVFGKVGPAATMILGVRFVDAEMKVEIEADAVVL
ncbi:YjgF-like protein [Crassisporium funariophilum]|nr:YjgF-like protein [Crassisporium funariophilum]